MRGGEGLEVGGGWVAGGSCVGRGRVVGGLRVRGGRLASGSWRRPLLANENGYARCRAKERLRERGLFGAPLINSKFPAIIISKHRAKTPRTKEKEEKNWEQLLPKTPFPPPHSDISFYDFYR